MKYCIKQSLNNHLMYHLTGNLFDLTLNSKWEVFKRDVVEIFKRSFGCFDSGWNTVMRVWLTTSNKSISLVEMVVVKVRLINERVWSDMKTRLVCGSRWWTIDEFENYMWSLTAQCWYYHLEIFQEEISLN